ncbi:serine/threonine-protein kinase [Nocardia sp. NRRL S-836]|uniref:serine/threonine-protein kinase n=1 Tax=Nocardia sp. NRRL S-836 TaxID=1519492 RepID=UPI0006AF9CCB|nr:serine/threonine-protein kinase [Nocardia sp. NRRL S-836]
MNKLGDRYVLLDQLGAGAMGVVWRARDELLHRDVAVKQLLLTDVQPQELQEAIQRAMREARIAARLQHPNAIGVFDVVVENGKPCLVMEYLPSRNLSSVLDERGPMPPVEAARIGSLAANALAAAHEAGIVHRDIKPGNVLIGRDGAVKITDFGISRALGDVAVTKTGMLAGTPAYLAPELARGSEPAPPSDVFSLGATIYAMTEGEPPFGRSTNDLGLLYKVARGETRPPVRSGPLTPLLTRLLANEPHQRPTAAQAAEALKAVANGRQVPATTILPPTGTPPGGTAIMPPGTPPGGTAAMRQGPGTMRPAGPPTARPSGPPSRPPTARQAVPAGPPPGPPTRPPRDPEPEPEPRKGRGLAVAASVLAVLLVAGIVYAIATSQKGDDTTANPGPSTSDQVKPTQPPAGTRQQTTTANTPTQKPTSQGYPSPPASASQPAGGSRFTKAQVVQFVQQHYGKLPANPDAAIKDFTKDSAPTPQAYKDYWKAYSKVALRGSPIVEASDGSFTVTVAMDLTETEADKPKTEEHTLEVSGQGEKLLIASRDHP